MIHFCIGSVLKCISLCKKRGKGVSDAYISDILFPMSEATGFIGHIKDCTKNLPYDVQRYMVSTDRESIEDGISTSVKEIINGILDTNRFKILVLALRDIIANDYSIDADTIIGFDAKYKKRTLAQQSMFLLPEFLTNVLVYVMSSGNNTVGRSSINNLNEAYLASFEEKQDSITITLLKNQENRGIRESWEKIDRINPFKYNSCTTELIGRENELAALHRFLEQDENISVKWWAITGVGGSGKSRLAFEFACGLDKDVWHSEFITRDRPFVFEQLQMISDKDTRNLLLVIDNDSSDMEPLANWLSYIYDRKENRQIRVLICQRVKINEGENCMAPWRESLLDYNEIVGTLLYEDAKIGSAVDVPSLEDQSQKAISASYSKLVYKKNLDEIQKNAVVQRLKEIDEKNCRPLYLLLLTDALVTGDIENIHNEDGLLNYAFVRERNIIRSRIKAAFGFSIKHHRKLYEEIEVSYADAVVSRAGGISQGIADMSKECGISKEHYSNLCEEYGLTVNNNIPVIEPDLLAEYYVMRYADKFCHLWGIQEFWVPFFRDFNKLLTTKYTKALKQVLSIIPFVIINYYIRGIYEASFATNDEDEQFWLIELMKNTFETAYEILGPEYDERPYASITGGRKGALGLMAPMILDKIDMFLDRMIRKAAGFSNVRNVRRTKDYIEFYSVYAARLYKNLTQRMRNNEENCLKFIDDLNELETFYQETKGQESEVAWYHSHALYIAMAFFFCREYRYEDELASQLVQNGMKRLKEIMEADGDYHEKENYIKSLMILYENDDNNFYKSKLEIWEEIRSYLIEFMESGDQDEERKNLFYCFLGIILIHSLL